MPTYVYKFIDTGETIEIQQSFDDATLTEAVHPGSGDTLPVKKVFLPVGVTFKGDGFYKTDSRSNRATTGTTSSSDTADKSGSGGASSTTGTGSSSTAPAGGATTSTAASGD
ncbi:MAG TPA: FmdB family transcriptional regulator [Ilumatobacter sp.]